jgi:glycosyltransferase involved in cell wall biosynthesis
MISVCLTTYNGERFLYEQIFSILNQLSSCDELIISDDGSNDNTVEIIKSFDDPRIKFYSNRFGDVIKNFEFTITKSEGNIIFLSDQDDIWVDGKVSSHLSMYIDDNPQLVLSDYYLINSVGTLLSKKPVKSNYSRSFIINLIKNNGIGCTMSFNKRLKDIVLPFPKSIPMHDWWIFLIAILACRVIYIDSKLTMYRRHDNNFTKDINSTVFLKLKWRLNLLINIIKRVVRVKFIQN